MAAEYKISESAGTAFLEHPIFQNSRTMEDQDRRFQDMLAFQNERKSSVGGKRISEDGFSGPTEAELRQIKAERKKKWEREAEYCRLLEESSLERRFKEKINVKKYPHGSFTMKSTFGDRDGQQEEAALL